MLCILFFCVICEKKNIGELSWRGFSLTELTDLTELFCAQFEPMRRWPLPQPAPFPPQKKGTSTIAYPLLWLDSVRA